VETENWIYDMFDLLLQFDVTQRLPRYTQSPEIHGRNPENLGQTWRIGNVNYATVMVIMYF